ncbi:glucans biosynthesis glucosyltransferase MdoH [Roseibium aggregatum]|uniref:Glucans biosynthesis glucosyltransferase H n=1 Tax=Roseibium aggregatum TaxID=187304 RepID=A0A939J262_9HYPH|nr:glucans biosynthesis glucosyltransferase MdoH [Roseibium aggregatum]MBN9668745.1 glucans biosynthesis glucosyltransferase MdoH [Roseibium aggregatum]
MFQAIKATYSGQPAPGMTPRRVLFSALLVLSFVGLSALMAVTLSPGGLTPLDLFILLCFMVTLPWTIIGFWNAVIGLLVMRLSKDPIAAVCPIDQGNPEQPLTCSTALLSCVRDEDTESLETTLSAMVSGLVRAGQAEHFSLYVLSDTSMSDIALQEQQMIARLRERFQGQMDVTYRRRTENTGYKAGNIEDFCERWGNDHDFALVLDADSYMSAEAISGLVRRMEANPQLGILQSLVVGLPTDSAFARIFQFGMRLGMRSYTIGSAWWQGDCGPYWGHNALLRLKPFKEHCKLPVLPGKGPLAGTILSHDQVEAVLMRRAGYEVRVLPMETGSYEVNPPHLLEFIRRDLRWCQGNLQYRRLLSLPGLKLVSRAQLFLAMLMFLGSPAWIGFMTAAAVLGMTTDYAPYRADTGSVLFFTVLTMVFAPKLATVADVLARRDMRKAFGGPVRVLLSVGAEILYSSMLAPIMAVAHSLFMGGLMFGKTIGWGAQARGVQRLPLALAGRKLWPQALFGSAALAWVTGQPFDLVWPIIPVAVGPLLAPLIAVSTSTKTLGTAAIRSTLWRIPEETAPPAELADLHLPTLLIQGHVAATPQQAMVQGDATTAEA